MRALGLGLAMNKLGSPRFRGLLDKFGGAAAAYSLRALSSGWLAGDVVEVRRSSDGTLQSFTASQITNGDLVAFTGAGDGFVSTWYDQSGFANDATQGTTTAQPKIVSAGALVVGGLDFDGVDDMFGLTTTLTAQPFSTFAVYKSLANSGYVYGHTGVLPVAGRRSTGTYILHHGSALDGGAHSSSEIIASYLANGATSSIHVNSVSKASGDAGNTSNNISVIGASSAARLDGTINEVIIYNSDQSANRVAIETNINDFYSIY